MPQDSDVYPKKGKFVAVLNNLGIILYAFVKDVPPFCHLQGGKMSETIDNLNNSALQKMQQGDYDGAIADFTEIIRLHPNDGHAYTNRSGAYAMKLDFESAIADANRAIELEPTYFLAYNNRASGKFHQQDYSGALADYDECIRLKPDYYPAIFERGNCRYHLEDYEGAIAEYDMAIRMNPQFDAARHNRAAAIAMRDKNKKKRKKRFGLF